ncbi:hypothetical protein [Acaryochloris sp. CCMEE 5410]|uniref:hypothetical protein n=1 Tax=Acaryochloris sp. CCMEE 5410 TaxID=310037 RepID=UPI000248480B|nr:hypothetical protein [Acaryochloris sp. CCMEE 5410]KAI9131086.1 hypothetical protein ON05_025765 [Acaryochloris sp. CCMEE 5410]
MSTDQSLPQLPCILRYKREVAVVFMLLGGLNVGLGMWLLFLGEFQFPLILGCLIGYIGFGYFTKPIAAIHPDHVVLYNMLGREVRSYSLETFSDLQLQGRQLYVQQGDALKKVRLSPWIIHAKDWQKLETMMRSQPQLQAK